MTATFTKSEIFKMAWELARAYAEAEGTGPRAQFGRALKEIHASAKLVAKQAAADLHRRQVLAQDERAEDEAARAAYRTRYNLTARAA